MTIPSYIHRVHPRAKRMTLKVNSKGEVIVVTPRFTPQWTIKMFVGSHADWISTQLDALKNQMGSQSDSAVMLFGKDYILTLKYTSALPAGIHIQKDTLLLNPTEPPTGGGITSNHQDQLDRFLKRTARSYIEPRTAQLSQAMGIEYGDIRLKEQKSRWGSCSSDGNLNFNWRLVHSPPEVIDYVIVHELAHRVHMNHSLRFWNLVAKYDPDHKMHRGWLKRNGKFFV